MIPQSTLQLDPRRASDVVADLRTRLPGYLSDSFAPDDGPSTALAWIHAHYLEVIFDRLNQVPEKSKLVFFDQLGIEPTPARAARAPMVFQLAEKAPAITLPAGARVAAPPPPESSEPIVFETERNVGLTPARIVEVVCLWPGRDQYIDHSEPFLAGTPIRPFDRSELLATPHELYVAHDVLLALAGKVKIDVEFDLSQIGSESLDMLWEYWDGEIWRGFKAERPACSMSGGRKLDGTDGLTRSGKIRLETDCAESAKVEVHGIEAYWIRARLDERLPVDPQQILPEVAQLRLSTVVERPLTVLLASQSPREFEDGGPSVVVHLTDTNNGPIADAIVEYDGKLFATKEDGATPPIRLPRRPPQRIELKVSVFDSRHLVSFDFLPSNLKQQRLELDLVFQLGGLLPDIACSEAGKIDLGAPFFPLGQYPQPGSAFYFSCAEVFNKPGARLTLYLTNVETPQDSFDVTPGKIDDDRIQGSVEKVLLEHRINWEYWNGSAWMLLQSFSTKSPVKDAEDPDPRLTTLAGDFTKSEQLHFVVPDDMVPIRLLDHEALWMRARLASGGYGFLQQVYFRWNRFQTVITRPPAVADFRMSYTWEIGPFHAERVLAYNDFEFVDCTDAARWPGISFKPFAQVEDMLPAIYFGHTRPLPVELVNLFFDVTESRDSINGPALVWEYWNGFRWRHLSAEDETEYLVYSGMVALIGPSDAQPRPRFGNDRYWVRARLKEDGPPPQPEIRGIHLNAVWASQQQTIVNEVAGVSTGLPNQSFRLRHIPILDGERHTPTLDGERIEIRERSGARANVEWRILAIALFKGNQQVLRELDQQIGSEAAQVEFQRGDLRLRRDRNKHVTEVWIRWQTQSSFLDSQPDDRHYVLDRQRGLLRFGDGAHGMAPPVGAQVVMRTYRSGGGAAGNVAAGAISQSLAGVAGVESVFNPKPAEGGADAETLQAFGDRGPRSVRHRGRAVTLADYETMAVEASPVIAVAQAFPAHDLRAARRPGCVTLVIIPRSDEPRPWPSPGLRNQVRKYVEARASAAVAAAGQVFVTGPDYLPIDVDATIAPVDASSAGPAESAARRAIENFLHPLTGGPTQSGWRAGRDVYLSDLAGVLERVTDVDYVRDLAFLLDGVPKGETVSVPPGKTVVAGQIRIKLVIE